MTTYRMLRACALAIVCLLLIGACGDDDDDSTDGEGDSSAEEETTEPVADAESVSVFDLEESQCLVDVAQVQQQAVEEVDVVGCDSGHSAEVFSVFDLEGGGEAEFPGTAEIEEQATSECGSAFEDYVGTSVDDSELEATFLAPSEETWGQGDREVVCIAFSEDVLTESIEGSGS
jgi:putative regulator of septum formation